MALVFKKVTEYDWEVTVQSPEKGKFKKETFTAKFKNEGRKAFADLIEAGDENFEALTDNHFIVKGIIEAFGESMRGASEKN